MQGSPSFLGISTNAKIRNETKPYFSPDVPPSTDIPARRLALARIDYQYVGPGPGHYDRYRLDALAAVFCR